MSGRRVYMDRGEVVPVFCRCGRVYQPKRDSEESRCPKCGRVNDHDEHRLEECR